MRLYCHNLSIVNVAASLGNYFFWALCSQFLLSSAMALGAYSPELRVRG
jgi:hypothetical protein